MIRYGHRRPHYALNNRGAQNANHHSHQRDGVDPLFPKLTPFGDTYRQGASRSPVSSADGAYRGNAAARRGPSARRRVANSRSKRRQPSLPPSRRQEEEESVSTASAPPAPQRSPDAIAFRFYAAKRTERVAASVPERSRGMSAPMTPSTRATTSTAQSLGPPSRHRSDEEGGSCGNAHLTESAGFYGASNTAEPVNGIECLPGDQREICESFIQLLMSLSKDEAARAVMAVTQRYDEHLLMSIYGGVYSQQSIGRRPPTTHCTEEEADGDRMADNTSQHKLVSILQSQRSRVAASHGIARTFHSHEARRNQWIKENHHATPSSAMHYTSSSPNRATNQQANRRQQKSAAKSRNNSASSETPRKRPSAPKGKTPQLLRGRIMASRKADQEPADDRTPVAPPTSSQLTDTPSTESIGEDIFMRTIKFTSGSTMPYSADQIGVESSSDQVGPWGRRDTPSGAANHFHTEDSYPGSMQGSAPPRYCAAEAASFENLQDGFSGLTSPLLHPASATAKPEAASKRPPIPPILSSSICERMHLYDDGVALSPGAAAARQAFCEERGIQLPLPRRTPQTNQPSDPQRYVEMSSTDLSTENPKKRSDTQELVTLDDSVLRSQIPEGEYAVSEPEDAHDDMDAAVPRVDEDDLGSGAEGKWEAPQLSPLIKSPPFSLENADLQVPAAEQQPSDPVEDQRDPEASINSPAASSAPSAKDQKTAVSPSISTASSSIEEAYPSSTSLSDAGHTGGEEAYNIHPPPRIVSQPAAATTGTTALAVPNIFQPAVQAPPSMSSEQPGADDFKLPWEL